MIQVKDGNVIKTKLPTTGYINGRAVSNYHKLDSATLKKEGWLPVEKVEPEYDNASEQLVFDRYDILKTKIKTIYRVEELPAPKPEEPEQPTVVDLLIERVEKLEDQVKLFSRKER